MEHTMPTIEITSEGDTQDGFSNSKDSEDTDSTGSVDSSRDGEQYNSGDNDIFAPVSVKKETGIALYSDPMVKEAAARKLRTEAEARKEIEQRKIEAQPTTISDVVSALQDKYEQMVRQYKYDVAHDSEAARYGYRFGPGPYSSNKMNKYGSYNNGDKDVISHRELRNRRLLQVVWMGLTMTLMVMMILSANEGTNKGAPNVRGALVPLNITEVIENATDVEMDHEWGQSFYEWHRDGNTDEVESIDTEDVSNHHKHHKNKVIEYNNEAATKNKKKGHHKHHHKHSKAGEDETVHQSNDDKSKTDDSLVSEENDNNENPSDEESDTSSGSDTSASSEESDENGKNEDDDTEDESSESISRDDDDDGSNDDVTPADDAPLPPPPPAKSEEELELKQIAQEMKRIQELDESIDAELEGTEAPTKSKEELELEIINQEMKQIEDLDETIEEELGEQEEDAESKEEYRKKVEAVETKLGSIAAGLMDAEKKEQESEAKYSENSVASSSEDDGNEDTLPWDWREYSDPDSGKLYFVNSQTGETTWTRPEIGDDDDDDDGGDGEEEDDDGYPLVD